MILNPHYKDIKVDCPNCGKHLNIYDHIYYNESCDGETYKDFDIEWECPNGCVFDDTTVANIDTEITSQIEAL